jgi:hypothetical protein
MVHVVKFHPQKQNKISQSDVLHYVTKYCEKGPWQSSQAAPLKKEKKKENIFQKKLLKK